MNGAKDQEVYCILNLTFCKLKNGLLVSKNRGYTSIIGTMTPPTDTLVLIGNLVLSGFLGAIIGIERDLSGRPAGIRTNMIVAMGACLFGMLSAIGYADSGGQQDATRIASQIVTGIGFIGAGALLKNDNKVLGLTTAADVWLVAAIGVAVATQWYSLAIAATLLAALGLPLLAPLSHKLGEAGEKRMKKKGKAVVKEG